MKNITTKSIKSPKSGIKTSEQIESLLAQLSETQQLVTAEETKAKYEGLEKLIMQNQSHFIKVQRLFSFLIAFMFFIITVNLFFIFIPYIETQFINLNLPFKAISDRIVSLQIKGNIFWSIGMIVINTLMILPIYLYRERIHREKELHAFLEEMTEKRKSLFSEIESLKQLKNNK